MEGDTPTIMLDDEGFPMHDPNAKPRTQEEIDADIEYFVKHPLNARHLTPEMLDMPEFQALQSLAYDGTPEEVALNFRVGAKFKD